jgi:hypothetical protein
VSITVDEFVALPGDRVIFIYDEKRGTRRSGVVGSIETHWHRDGIEMRHAHSYHTRIDGKRSWRWLAGRDIVSVVEPAIIPTKETDHD